MLVKKIDIIQKSATFQDMNDFKKALVNVCITLNYVHQVIECKRTRYSRRYKDRAYTWKATTRMDKGHVLASRYYRERTCGNLKLGIDHNKYTFEQIVIKSPGLLNERINVTSPQIR